MIQKKILVADDDSAICDSLCILLEDQGFTVQTMTSGDTMRTIQKFSPDIILLDIWLAGADGREICKQIKKIKLIKKIPIIMISASKDAASSARNAGADDFLSKPFQINDLLQKVKRCMSQSIQ